MRLQRTLFMASWLGMLLTAGVSTAQPGPAPAGTAIAEYNRVTGQVFVSFTDLQPEFPRGGWAWELISASGGFSADTPQNLPEITFDPLNPWINDTDVFVGVRYATNPPSVPWTEINLDLGRIALRGLDDIRLTYTNSNLITGTVFIVPEPASLEAIIILCITAYCMKIRARMRSG